jgi:phage terminase large subunit-like protein
MNEGEKQVLRDLKVRMTERLRECVKKRGRKIAAVWATDERIRTYVKAVAKNPEKHNVWEICAIVRFFEMLDRYDWHAKRAKLMIKMLELLKFQTDDGLRRVRLQPVQVFMVCVPYGLVKRVKVPVTDHATLETKMVWRVKRVIRNVVWMVPRKFGKTTLIAGMAVVEFFFGPSDAEIDIVSTTGRQAKICYGMIKLAMMDLVATNPLLERVKLRFNRESLFYDDKRDGAQAVNVFGDNPAALNGLKPSVAIEDESASMVDTASKAGNESRNTLESGQGPRLEPLSFQITTASKYVTGPFAQSLIGLKSVLMGERDNDEVFAMLFCPDVDDDESAVETWKKVHPLLGVTVQADYYAREWEKCIQDRTYLTEFRTKQLNVFDVPIGEAWIGGATVAKLMIDWDPMAIPVGGGILDAMMAIDLAQKWDFTAVSTAIYREDLRQIWVHTKCFLPDGIRVWTVPVNTAEGQMYLERWENPNEHSEGPSIWKVDENYVYLEEAPFDGKIHSGHPNSGLYQRWIDQGELVLTHGVVVDYDVVAQYVVDVSDHVSVQKIGYDDYKWREFANFLARRGGSDGLVAFGQTHGDFTAPTIFFERGVEMGSILLAKSEVVRWCFDNAVLDTDARGNVKPMKIGDYRRIDPVITDVMACGLWSDLGHTRHTKNDFDD